MSLENFFSFVEIRTKLASIIPFLLGTVYALYRYKSFRVENFLIMLISLLAFDMATTAINNYIDYKKASHQKGYNYERMSVVVHEGITEPAAKRIIFTLLTIACVFGILLTIKTSIIVLMIGAVSFFIGVFYTFGPIPISRMPLGELFSGVFMGFVIMFLSIYIHVYDQGIVTLVYHQHMLTFRINLLEIFYIFLMSVPAMGGIANIMLANNICDVEEDIGNKRFTLPYYIGRKNALQLFKALYYIGYVDLILLLIVGVAPIAALLGLITLPPVIKNIRLFTDKPIKSETFGLSVKNFMMMNAVQVIIVGAMVVVHYSSRLL